MSKVVVGLSGGVDSSVAAYLLQKAGHEVIGLFMRNWKDDTVILSEECPWVEDSNDAMLVAEKLGIPFQLIDLSAAYKERIVDYMFREYQSGRTPNPDVLCNREIKYDLFLEIALKLGADYVATGHYCRKDQIDMKGTSIFRLLKGTDIGKDQSYFLCQLNQHQLSKALFPIGHLQKSEVRAIARDLGLITAEKRDSQGLCFIGKVRLPDFLKQKLKPKKGEIIEIAKSSLICTSNETESGDLYQSLQALARPLYYKPSDGKKVGTHEGAHFFTIGQRKGLRVGGTPEPLFVLQSDVENNILFVGQGKDHPGLYRKALFIKALEAHWLREDKRLFPGESMSVMVRIRYRQPLQAAILYCFADGMYMKFSEPQSSITPGQFAVWYEGEELLGSGVIAA